MGECSVVWSGTTFLVCGLNAPCDAIHMTISRADLTCAEKEPSTWNRDLNATSEESAGRPACTSTAGEWLRYRYMRNADLVLVYYEQAEVLSACYRLSLRWDLNPISYRLLWYNSLCASNPHTSVVRLGKCVMVSKVAVKWIRNFHWVVTVVTAPMCSFTFPVIRRSSVIPYPPPP